YTLRQRDELILQNQSKVSLVLLIASLNIGHFLPGQTLFISVGRADSEVTENGSFIWFFITPALIIVI
ncbi:MAG: hypothetical protein WBL03_01210, partial [bacterium]